MNDTEEADVLTRAEAFGLTLQQTADGRWITTGDEGTAPSFPGRQFALIWLANRVLTIDAARSRHPSGGLAARYGRQS
jgi:hypothetical protein